MQSYAFWVFEEGDVVIEVEADCDWQRLLFENGGLVVKINQQHGASYLKGGQKHQLTLGPGIYGLVSDGEVSYAVKKGKVEVRTKAGKDPWPLPPPPPVPQGFEEVSLEIWRDYYGRVFLIAAEQEVESAEAKTSEERA